MSYQSIEDLVIDIPDYPKAGVIFKDITPVVDDPEAFKEAVEALGDHFKGMGVTKVVSAEARGFLFGAPVAYQMGVGFVPARKPGKLPRECFSEEYALEYGTNSIEIHKDALTSDDKVLVVDDLVATGGTAIACGKLAQKAGAEVVGFGFLMELAFLKPKQTIKDAFGLDLFSLIQVD
ncbi:MAG: adenine phosphoribosyltransferase [Atopobiaceae bacterium]|nr:adenine phosphoribosyltransferase [Atopobiaceae bacterium]MCH4119271.1 adenine phosphoribosyltransferase [Atopobiaceae bacterium]MCI1318056.1 adenine phosphoribosyltransferase [Atopobiaceae bacterium]MCI1388469.1 adenine phosphoribosyltransferase [Atopobiaceae bacterium]MCI1431968.1 adenine phosphoribosyltransferase [Atopobiaceae bacterium]